jgi:hypothetical protein
MRRFRMPPVLINPLLFLAVSAAPSWSRVIRAASCCFMPYKAQQPAAMLLRWHRESATPAATAELT